MLQCETPHLAFTVSTMATSIEMTDFVASTASMTVTSIGMTDFVTSIISTTSLFLITSVFPSFRSFLSLRSLRSSTYLLVPYPCGDCYSYGYGAYHGEDRVHGSLARVQRRLASAGHYSDPTNGVESVAGTRLESSGRSPNSNRLC